jgi:tetratricopeptide (TPR) repeat protein
MGFLLHGLVLDVTPESRAGYVLTLLCGTLLLRALAGSRAEDESEEAAPTEALGHGERLGLFAIGLGAALALETLAHEVRLFTLGTSADDTVIGGVFLALVVIGAASFGPLLARLGHERLRFAVCLAASAAAALLGILFLKVLSQDGLHGYLRRFDPILGVLRTFDGKLGGRLGLAAIPTLDGASIGTLWTTAILAAAALIAPAFVLGAALGGSRHAGRLVPALVGAAAGLVVLPFLIRARGVALTFDQLDRASFTWELVMAGTSAAAVGLLLVAVTGQAARAAGCVAAMVVALVPWLRPRLALWSLSPWSPKPVRPELIWPTAEGLLTIESAREDRAILTLDRKRMTPLAEEEEADERRLRLAWSLLPEERRSGKVRALFLGQVTPPRANVLRSLGTLDLERTAPWYGAMATLEKRLFRGEEPPPGRIVATAEARARLSRGDYDWVVAAPTFGPIVTWKSEAREIWGSAEAPRLTDLELPAGTLGVAWLGGDSLAARGTTFDPLILTVERLESFSLGLVRGLELGEQSAAGPTFRVASYTGPRPARTLCTMPQLRAFRDEQAWAASLECAAAPELTRGLALHFGVQQLSSPYETRAQQIEIEEDALRAFFAAAPQTGALDPFTRVLWEALAWLFMEKRMPEQALVYLEPLAERFAPWPALDRAVARAYLEVLEPATARRFLERARLARPEDIELLLESARCAQAQGDVPGAVAFLEQVYDLYPDRPDVERAVGLELMRCGDARGRKLLEQRLAKNPDDKELEELLARPQAPETGGE